MSSEATRRENRSRDAPVADMLEYFANASGESPDLPSFAELEPGAVLHRVKEAWRDGRRKGLLTEQQIADEIADSVPDPFTRNMYLSMFGDGARAGDDGKRARQAVPPAVAREFLRTLLKYWSIKRDGSFEPFPTRHDVPSVIEKICAAMYAKGKVYCRAAPGRGPRSVFLEIGKRQASVIVATEQSPVVMQEPAEQIDEWIRAMRAIFSSDGGKISSISERAIHVWAILEPAIGPRENLEPLEGIENLRKVLSMARTMIAVQPSDSSDAKLWGVIRRRGVIAIKKHPQNHGDPILSRRAGSWIAEEHIFPRNVPDRWVQEGRFESLSGKELNSLVSISGEGSTKEINYYVFSKSEIPPFFFFARSMLSPGRKVDESFLKLYRACLQFANRSDVENAVDFSRAKDEGWVFLTVDDWLHGHLPAPATNELHDALLSVRSDLRDLRSDASRREQAFARLLKALDYHLPESPNGANVKRLKESKT